MPSWPAEARVEGWRLYQTSTVCIAHIGHEYRCMPSTNACADCYVQHVAHIGHEYRCVPSTNAYSHGLIRLVELLLLVFVRVCDYRGREKTGIISVGREGDGSYVCD